MAAILKYRNNSRATPWLMTGRRDFLLPDPRALLPRKDQHARSAYKYNMEGTRAYLLSCCGIFDLLNPETMSSHRPITTRSTALFPPVFTPFPGASGGLPSFISQLRYTP